MFQWKRSVPKEAAVKIVIIVTLIAALVKNGWVVWRIFADRRRKAAS